MNECDFCQGYQFQVKDMLGVSVMNGMLLLIALVYINTNSYDSMNKHHILAFIYSYQWKAASGLENNCNTCSLLLTVMELSPECFIGKKCSVQFLLS